LISIYNGSNWSDSEFAGSLNTGGSAQVRSVSCLSATFCAIGGFYSDGSGSFQAFVSTFNGNGWTTQEVAQSLNEFGSAGVDSVSCVTTTFCIAGGHYSTATPASFASAYNGSSWTDYVTHPPVHFLDSNISCASTSFCVAAGGGVFNGSTWSAFQPAASLDANAQASTVICRTSSFCVAGGGYWASPSHQRAFVSFFYGASWYPSEVAATLDTGGGSYVNSLSCQTKNFCVAGGSVWGPSGDSQAFVSVYNGTSWSDQAIAHSLNTGGAASVSSVSCTSAHFCAAGGTFKNQSGYHAFVSLYNGTTWTDYETASALNTGGWAVVNSVYCASATFCVEVGQYAISANGGTQAFVSVYNGTLHTVTTPAKTTITCVKGKVTKKVTAVNPTCPAGFKKVSVQSKRTITCVKGKTTKKVTAVNPVCPAGYKKK